MPALAGATLGKMITAHLLLPHQVTSIRNSRQRRRMGTPAGPSTICFSDCGADVDTSIPISPMMRRKACVFGSHELGSTSAMSTISMVFRVSSSRSESSAPSKFILRQAAAASPRGGGDSLPRNVSSAGPGVVAFLEGCFEPGSEGFFDVGSAKLSLPSCRYG
jgi:hypothetical protein